MNKEKPKNVIIYCRVSTKEQVEEGNSLYTQERICKEYAEKYGYDIAKIFREEGESAKTALRPELQNLLKYCSKNHKEIDSVVVYKIDRLSRNTDDYSQLRMLFGKLNIKIVSTSEKFGSDPVGKFIENMLANVSQFDNDVRSERCKNGMIEAVRSGRYVWKAPVGYANAKINGSSNIKQDKAKAKFIKRIFELMATGLYQVEEMRKIINEEGFLVNNKPVRKSYFHQLLRNKLYMGIIDVFDMNVRGDFEPIVNEALFNKVQFILESKGRKMLKYTKSNPDFPLKSFVFNSQNCKLDGSWARGNGGKYAYYRFRNFNGFNAKKKDVEDKFMEYLDSFEYKNDFKGMLKTAIELNWENRNKGVRKTANQKMAEIRRIKEKQGLIIEKNLKGIIPDDLAKEQLEETNQKIAGMSIELQEYDSQKEDIKDALECSFNFLENPSKEWEKLNIDAKCKIQWFLFPKGVLFENGKFRTNETALVLDIKKTFQSEKSSLVDRTGLEPATSSVQMRRSTR